MAPTKNSNLIISLDSSDDESSPIEQQVPVVVRKFVISRQSPPPSATISSPSSSSLSPSSTTSSYKRRSCSPTMLPQPDALELADPLEMAMGPLSKRPKLSVSSSSSSSGCSSASCGSNSDNEDVTPEELQQRRQRDAEVEALQRMHGGFQLAFKPPVQARPTIEDQQSIDQRSVFVANVDYQTTNTQLQQVFERCGPINRITINRTRDGQPKGCAYVEFEKRPSVVRAFRLTGFVLNGRPIRVTAKRTNVQGVDTPRAPYIPAPRFQTYSTHDKRWTSAAKRQPLKWVNPNLKADNAAK